MPPVRTMPVESTCAAARPCVLKKMVASGIGLARGIERPGREPERVADRELEAGGGDLQAARRGGGIGRLLGGCGNADEAKKQREGRAECGHGWPCWGGRRGQTCLLGGLGARRARRWIPDRRAPVLSGTKTYPYATFGFYLDGQFTGHRSFSPPFAKVNRCEDFFTCLHGDLHRTPQGIPRLTPQKTPRPPNCPTAAASTRGSSHCGFSYTGLTTPSSLWAHLPARALAADP